MTYLIYFVQNKNKFKFNNETKGLLLYKKVFEKDSIYNHGKYAEIKKSIRWNNIDVIPNYSIAKL